MTGSCWASLSFSPPHRKLKPRADNVHTALNTICCTINTQLWHKVRHVLISFEVVTFVCGICAPIKQWKKKLIKLCLPLCPLQNNDKIWVSADYGLIRPPISFYPDFSNHCIRHGLLLVSLTKQRQCVFFTLSAHRTALLEYLLSISDVLLYTLFKIPAEDWYKQKTKTCEQIFRCLYSPTVC